jgi:hypothetical protein
MLVDLLSFNVHLGRQVVTEAKKKILEDFTIPMFSRREKTRYIRKSGRQLVKSERFTKFTFKNPIFKAVQEGIDKIETILETDDDIELDIVGKHVKQASTILTNADGLLCYNYVEYEVKYGPDGKIIPCDIDKEIYCEHRIVKTSESNINEEKNPVMWIGQFQLGYLDALKMWSFDASYQLHHMDGAQYKLLFGMAKELQDSQKLVLLATIVNKKPQPLVIREGGKPFFAWLEGRVMEDAYALILHKTTFKLT